MFRCERRAEGAGRGIRPGRLPPGPAPDREVAGAPRGLRPARPTSRPGRSASTARSSSEVELTWDEFERAAAVEQTQDIHCVTRWSRFDTRSRACTGASSRSSASRSRPPASRSRWAEHDFTTNVPLESLEDDLALLATHARRRAAHARSRLPAAPRRAAPVLLEECQVGARDRARARRPPGLLGEARLPQRRRSLGGRAVRLLSEPPGKLRVTGDSGDRGAARYGGHAPNPTAKRRRAGPFGGLRPGALGGLMTEVRAQPAPPREQIAAHSSVGSPLAVSDRQPRRGSRETRFPRCSLHHPRHVRHAAAGRAGRGLLGRVGNDALGREHVLRDRGGVLERRARDHRRVDDARGDEIASTPGLRRRARGRASARARGRRRPTGSRPTLAANAGTLSSVRRTFAPRHLVGLEAREVDRAPGGAFSRATPPPGRNALGARRPRRLHRVLDPAPALARLDLRRAADLDRPRPRPTRFARRSRSRLAVEIAVWPRISSSALAAA